MSMMNSDLQDLKVVTYVNIYYICMIVTIEAYTLIEELSGGAPTLLRSSKLLFVDARLA